MRTRKFKRNQCLVTSKHKQKGINIFLWEGKLIMQSSTTLNLGVMGQLIDQP